jgi:Right handed beta helix region
MRLPSLARPLVIVAVVCAQPPSALAHSSGSGHREAGARRHATLGLRRRLRRHPRLVSLSNATGPRRNQLGFPGSSAAPAPPSDSSSPGAPGSPGEAPASGPEGAGSVPSAGPPSTVEAPALQITGTTYYVSPGGSDSNSGTSPSSPWRTVRRANEADLRPGDGVLFQGGAVFSDDALMPASSGAPGSPIVFGSYGSGNAALALGVWFDGHGDLAFSHLTVGPSGNLQGTGDDVTVEWCLVEGSEGVGINAMGSNWTIDDNTVNHIGISGMLLEGDGDTVSGNTITNTGLDSSIPYGKHGIYLKVSNATVTRNTISDFSADGISARYRDATIAENYISDGPIGIGWFQYDPIAGTSHWTANTIVGVSEAGIYVSPSDQGGATRESFVIEHNSIEPLPGGVFFNLHQTSGAYLVQENTLL